MPENSSMRTLQLDLPDEMMEFIAEQIAEGDYDSPSEYIRDLVRADQKRHAKSQLETVLLRAANSGDPSDLTPEIVEQMRQRLRGRGSERS
jgi:antitoxin ParD1/3/4